MTNSDCACSTKRTVSVALCKPTAAVVVIASVSGWTDGDRSAKSILGVFSLRVKPHLRQAAARPCKTCSEETSAVDPKMITSKMAG